MTVQYDICENTDRTSRSRYPYLIILQSDLLQSFATAVVAPLAEDSPLSISKLHPKLAVNGKNFQVQMAALAAVPRNRLGSVVANARDHHTTFVAAIDLLFTGV